MSYTKIISQKEFLERLHNRRWSNEIPRPYSIVSSRGGRLRIGMASEQSDERNYEILRMLEGNSSFREFKAFAVVGGARATDILQQGSKLAEMLRAWEHPEEASYLTDTVRAVADTLVDMEVAYVVLDV